MACIGHKIFCVQSIINVFLKVNEGVCYIGYFVECITAFSVKKTNKKNTCKAWRSEPGEKKVMQK